MPKNLQKRPGSPHWHYQFNLEGKKFRGSCGTASIKQAEQVLAQAKVDAAAIVNTTVTPRHLITVGEAFDRYFDEHGQDTKSADQILMHLLRLKRIIGADIVAERLDDDNVRHVTKILKEDGLGPTARNRALAWLKASLNWSNLHPNIRWKMHRRPENYRIEYLTKSDYRRLLASCAHEETKLIIELAVSTGLRKTNIKDLRWRDLDADTGTLTVRSVKSTLDSKMHRVRISPALVERLKHHAISQDAARPLIDHKDDRKRWEAAREKAGLDRIVFHDLRHTFAAWAREEGVSIEDLKDMMAHSSVTMTMRYAHITPTKMESGFDKVAKAAASAISENVTQ